MKSISVILVFLSFSISQNIFSQTTLDPEIKKMVSEVESKSLQKTINKLVSFGTRHTLSDPKNTIRGIGAAQKWVKEEFDNYAIESLGQLTSVIDYFNIKADGKRILKDTEVANVMATLKGTDSKDSRILIISGHLDSRATDVMDAKIDAPGANDDGSGVAAMMEIAKIMCKRQFPYTIIFVAVTGEEQGLYGAKHLAEFAKTNNWNVVAMLNNDMIGNSLSSGTSIRNNTKVRVFSEAIPFLETEDEAKIRKQINRDNDSPSRQLARYIKTVTNQYVDQLDIDLVYRNDRFLRGGDHTPFMQNGFTAVRFCEMNENYEQQHQNLRTENGIKYGDLPEFMDFEYLRKVTCANLATLANLALAPNAPISVGIEIKELTNFSDLVWKSTESKVPFGYNVLIRETSSSHWEKIIFTKETKIKIPYSKDNYFFAVQSVNELGHCSLPIFPIPVKN